MVTAHVDCEVDEWGGVWGWGVGGGVCLSKGLPVHITVCLSISRLCGVQMATGI